MRNLLSLLLIIGLTFGFMLSEAQAKRFGGGRSFGVQRSMTNTFSRTSQPLQQAPKQGFGGNKWLAPLAGLAIGGLLSYLLMSQGLGSGLLAWIAIIGIGMLLFSLFRKRNQPAAERSSLYNQFQQNSSHNATERFMQQGSTYSSTQPSIANHYPAGFDETSFLREVKAQFIRLQAAFDSKNLRDLREFTTPEVFAEIQLQLQERGEANNQTDVVSLEASLLEATAESQLMVDADIPVMVASVRFSGLIKEETHTQPESFNEVWHFRKDRSQSAWRVSGIQQH